jgi:2-polyprenyl-3-methyl-5-hydroxy-6-metoxy-1,4-benzoquinol methylase
MSDNHNDMLLRQANWMEGWPPEGLESVPTCPVCNSEQRNRLHANLIDKVFYTAPGRWTLYCCQGCRSAYLDPRPSSDYIHFAYDTYHTHTPPEPRIQVEDMTYHRRLLRALANGYYNWRYGTKETPAIWLGIPASWFLPGLRHRLDLRYRYLPRPTKGSRVLDVGFGDGSFLEYAKAAGWDVAGVDPDARVIENARARGLNVRKGEIDTIADQLESFDAITMNHIIEHVHKPVTVLQTAFALLKPGGMLYMETPNIESQGHRIFGRNWRGLEPPRHLVIFSRAALRKALFEAGFHCIRFINSNEGALYTYPASQCLEKSKVPYRDCPLPDMKARVAYHLGRLQPSRLEYLKLVASKERK